MPSSTKKCKQCRKEYDIDSFQNEAKNKEYVKCFKCREYSKKWRQNNKERVSEYNKHTRAQNNVGEQEITLVYGRKVGEKKWKKYKSQVEASTKLNLHKPNINKVIKGSLKTTGGYEFKLKTKKINNVYEKEWKDIKKDKNYSNGPDKSPNRIEHSTIDGVIGKPCCTCKEWKPLTQYHALKSHWDGLRNGCKTCVAISSKKQREKDKESEHMINLAKLRGKLSMYIKYIKKNKKLDKFLAITNCTTAELKQHIEKQFTKEMTWKNHGTHWQLDHKIPCSAFDLTQSTEQFVCFNYVNLQPLTCDENMSKGSKYDKKDKEEFCKKVLDSLKLNN